MSRDGLASCIQALAQKSPWGRQDGEICMRTLKLRLAEQLSPQLSTPSKEERASLSGAARWVPRSTPGRSFSYTPATQPPSELPAGTKPSPALLHSYLGGWESSPSIPFPFVHLFHRIKTFFFIVKLKTYRKDARIAQWTPPYLSFMFAVTIFSICFVVPSPSPPSIYNFFSETSERKLKTW